jgi:2-methylcitrate dehydratase PrpD
MFVFGGKFPARHAAWVNAGMAHARDYDDSQDTAVLHAGVSSVPAAIAAGQLRGALSGPDLIAAIAAGLEVTCRLGLATKLDLIESGFIYTSLLGYFGANAAAGRAFGLTEAEMLNAFGIVSSSAAGNHQVTRDASLMKRLQPGLAAQAALVAVQLARRGIRGAQGVFEGADGFFRVYLRGAVRNDLGRRFELMNLSYKPYPCCRDVHTAIDAVLEVRARVRRPANDIERIRVGVTAPGYQMVCVPEPVRVAPRTIVEALFSIPYAVAASWIDGGLGIGHFSDEGLKRADILALAARVQPYLDAEIDRDWSRVVPPALVCVQFRDGETVEARVDYPKVERSSEKPDDGRGIRGQDDGLRDLRRAGAAGGHGATPHRRGRPARSAIRDFGTRTPADLTSKGGSRPSSGRHHRRGNRWGRRYGCAPEVLAGCRTAITDNPSEGPSRI